MRVVADTDVLSTFARIHKLQILKQLFDEVIIPPSVKSEPSRGRIDVKPLKPSLAQLAKEELKDLKSVDVRLGRGERECFVIAKSRNLPLASNEKIVLLLCRKDGIGCFTLPRILRFAIMEKVITREEARQLVKIIEEEENTVIRNKDEIFG